MRLKQKIVNWVVSFSPKTYANISYLHNRGKLPNLTNPQTLPEIIHCQILSGEINKYYEFADKIKVRDYIKEWGFEKYLPKIYGIWDSFDQIDFDKLPNRFALKTNHGAGNHYICNNKHHLDIDSAKKTINVALNEDYSKIYETHYQLIKPRIYCEEYIDDGRDNSISPIDYKFHCIDGELKGTLVVSDRNNKNAISYKLSTYDNEWNRLDYIKGPYKGIKEIDRPTNFQEMKDFALYVAKKFPQVRVDIYSDGKRIIFGELTFTAQGGTLSYFTNQAIIAFGRNV
jgi:hypothetical protein